MTDEDEKAAPLNLRDYLDAAVTASNRARNLILILVVSSVIISIGTIDTLQHGWAAVRLKRSNTIDSDYVKEKIGPPPAKNKPSYLEYQKAYEEHYRQLYDALARSYVDTALSVRAPLFGVTIDINDLGAIGGFALLIELAMFGIALRRECENLTIGFKRATGCGALPDFYDLLAMAQVLTIPAHYTGDRHRSRSVLKLICFLPLIALEAFVAHDIATNDTGLFLDTLYNNILLLVELLWLFIVLGLTTWTRREMHRADDIWDQWATVRFSNQSSTLM